MSMRTIFKKPDLSGPQLNKLNMFVGVEIKEFDEKFRSGL